MSKTITRKYIQRITKREGDTSIRRNGGGGGGGGGVSQYWVDDNYVSKEFFNRLFEIHDENGDPILPNDVETEIDNIQAMFGFWTNAYLSALGQNEGGGGVELTLASLADVSVQGVTDGQALVWSASQGKWVPGQGGGGTDMQTVWQELAATGTQQINKTHLTTALADYLPLAGGTMTNTNLVTNMNADLLDGQHGSYYATASSVTTLQGYFTNGVANSAAKLTTISKKAWGQTYWTSNGVPTDISGSITDATTITASGIISANGGIIIPSGKTLTIGDAVLSWDSTNQGIKITKGLYSETFISALGKGSGGSSGISIEAVWTALANSDSSKQISISHLTNALSNYNPTSNFKTVNGNSIIGTGNITIESSGGTVTAVKVGTTSYSPTDGVVSLPAYPTKVSQFTNDSGYITSSGSCASATEATRFAYISNWNSPKRGANVINLMTCGSSAADGAPTAYTSGISIVTSYVGFQLASFGGGGEALYFRKLEDNDTWHSWYEVITGANIGSQSVNYATSAGNASTADLANMIKNNITVSSSSSVDNGIWFNNGTRNVLFGTGASGNTGICVNGIGWVVGVNSSGSIFLNGNATSATQLQTSRTIWGQSFNGSANISGSLTGVENITSSSYSLRDSSSNPYLNLKIGSQNWYVQSYSDGIYIGSTSSKSLKVDASGNVTVAGTLGVSGLLTASGGITIPSGKTLTIGDAVLSWDSTNQGIKITKGLYSETFISALGKGSGGSSGISIEAVWTALANSDSSKQINASHLTNALAGYNPTSNFKTINGNSIIGTGDIAVSAGTGTVTSIVTGGTTYSPTNGVVTLPDNIVYHKEDAYLNASFLKAEYSQKAAQKYIEFWDSAGGWFNFMLGTLYATSDVKVGSNSVIHTGNIGSQSVNYANSASTLTNKSVTASTIDGLSGSFTFEGNELTTSGYDEVGIQIGSSVDKFQIIGKSGTLLIRQNDNGGTSTSDWTAWTMLPTKMYTRNLLAKTDQWYRVANLTTYGMSYIISIRESFFNREPTPATFIINTSYTNATITQIGRASRTPVSITKVRLVKYGNGTYHVELYTPELSGTSLASMSTSEVNIFNLGRENTSDGIILVHDPSDDTKWLEVDENIASGETLIEEANISTETTASALLNARTLWGQSFDGTADVSGTITSSYFKIQDRSYNPYLQFIGDNTNWYLQYYNGAMYMGTGYTNSIMINSSGNVGIGTTSPAYKLDVNGDVQATNFRGNFVGNADSATKLKTARTIWGQSFDGTANVSGAITNATTITASSNVSVGGTLGVTGATTLSSTLSVSGTSTLTGHVGIGTSPHSTYVLRANGEVYVSTGLYSHGYVTALSDIRHKEIKGDVKLTVSEVANAPAVKFMWKDRRQEGLQVGSIAQYWKKVLPEAIVEAADGELTMSYGVVALLASIANAREIVNLKREIAELKRKLQKHGILE